MWRRHEIVRCSAYHMAWLEGVWTIVQSVLLRCSWGTMVLRRSALRPFMPDDICFAVGSQKQPSRMTNFAACVRLSS